MEEFAQAIVDAAYEEIAGNGNPPLQCFHVGCNLKALVVRPEMELLEEFGESLLVDPDVEPAHQDITARIIRALLIWMRSDAKT